MYSFPNILPYAGDAHFCKISIEMGFANDSKTVFHDWPNTVLVNQEIAEVVPFCLSLLVPDGFVFVQYLSLDGMNANLNILVGSYWAKIA